MPLPTPPQEFLREIFETQHLISELCKSDISHVHWPSFYQFYVALDNLYYRVDGAARSLDDNPIAGYVLSDKQRCDNINACFSELQNQQSTIISWLSKFSRRPEMLLIGDKALANRLYCHFQPKSEWFDSFYREYSAGVVSANGCMLERTIQLLDPVPIYRIEDIGAKELVQHHSFYIAAESTRRDLCNIGRQAAKLVDKVTHETGEFFVHRCTIKDLLRPSTF